MTSISGLLMRKSCPGRNRGEKFVTGAVLVFTTFTILTHPRGTAPGPDAQRAHPGRVRCHIHHKDGVGNRTRSCESGSGGGACYEGLGMLVLGSSGSVSHSENSRSDPRTSSSA
jgi:hypothetical protein